MDKKTDNDSCTEQIKAMRQRTISLKHEGCYWSDDDRRQLQNLFEQGVGITKIALTLERSETAVFQQLRALNLYVKIRSSQKIGINDGCLCWKCHKECSNHQTQEK